MLNLGKAILAGGTVLALTAGAFAQSTSLRIQTHYAPETPSGQLLTEWAENVEKMSNGEIDIEMFYSSSVVKSVETFDAAATGILDCDATGGGYQTGKNSAFQFVADIMGGYATPAQQLSWFYYGGGFEAAQKLYNQYGMEPVGFIIYGQESFASSKPITSMEDFKDWKFRSPPGMETKIFEKIGAKPIVMDFTEIFTALESGIIDGADASGLANNVGLGLYDIVKYANYPGFHSMPTDHIACNKDVFDAMPDHHKTIMKVAAGDISLKSILTFEKKNEEAKAALEAQGVTISAWAPEDLQAFREAAQSVWPEFADTPEAKELLENHYGYLKTLGIVKGDAEGGESMEKKAE